MIPRHARARTTVQIACDAGKLGTWLRTAKKRQTRQRLQVYFGEGVAGSQVATHYVQMIKC